MRLVPLVLVLGLPVVLCCSCSKLPAADSNPPLAIADVAKSYGSYQKMTKDLTFVNPELAMLCRGASESEVIAARMTKGPHANAAIKIFMNATAARTFVAGTGVYETGAVIVKEKLPLGYTDMAARKRVRPHEGVGGMVKRAPGFDPEHGDWEYFYFEDPEKIETGAIASCVKCHEGAKKTDYVFGSWAAKADPGPRPRS